MEKFKTLHFKSLPNAAHFIYCGQISAAIATADEVIVVALGTLPAEFNNWLTIEEALMAWVRKNVLTEQVRRADDRMNRSLVTINADIRALQYSRTPGIAEAARKVNIMLKNYGKVYSKPYDDQDGDVYAILGHLQGEYAADVTLLGLGDEVTELNTAFTTFRQLLAERDAIVAQKPRLTFPVVRRGIESVYHQIVERINAGSLLNVSPAFAAFINNFNAEIDRLNAEFHRVRRHISLAEPDAIPPQLYTGEPVTPTPAVYCVNPKGETEKLELGKDYNFTYKNNLHAGNADCTLHGKGRFTGHKTVTFIIVNEL